MTNSDAQELFESFMASRTSTNSMDDYYSVAALDAFVDHAVKEGIIDDTPTQRLALTKAVVRGEFLVVVAAARAVGLSTAAQLLEHSLQDAPSNLTYGSASTYARQIENSSECAQIASLFESNVAGTVLNKYVLPGSTTLNSTTDLHLAYNRVSYTATGYKSGGNWRINIVFSDTYDFAPMDWISGLLDNAAITIINNYAAYAQEIGAIVPYNINITVSVYID